MLIVLTTVGSARVANALARRLVRERLAACVQVVPGVRSHYRWQGKCATDREQLLFIKTRRGLWRRLHARLKSLHPYEVPEIVALPVTKVAASYRRWLLDSLVP